MPGSSAKTLVRSEGLGSPDAVPGVLYSGEMTAQRVAAGIKKTEAKGLRSVEVIVHVERVLPEEKTRWSNTPSMGLFYLSNWRDRERAEIYSGLKTVTTLPKA